ncbi:MAG: phenylalanine--tRNA ligase subunit beta, partial [Thermodesulfobacteriota bacterium]
PSGCPRYTCRVIEDVSIEPSPEWLKNRLELSGIRSINNVVDITNFVLLELGQPLHAFDYDLLEDKKINIRFAKDRELLKILDGQERKLTSKDLLICDADKPVALGGVMGGLNTEVNEKTKNVLLESAYFDPVTIRKTSKRTGLKSDSSYRFERGVDPNNVVNALDRAAYLISEIAGGKPAKTAIDVYPSPVRPEEINVSVNKINNILGINIQSSEITDILKSIEFEILGAENDEISLKIPTFRIDITREIDVVEEIGRMFGYNNIPMVPPSVEMITEEVDSSLKLISKLKDIFISSGFFEAINYSFEDPDLLNMFSTSETLSLLNPLTNESSNMRTSILPGLIKDLKINLSHQLNDVRLFEYGKVFFPKDKGQLPKEETRFSAVATGNGRPEVWNNEELNFFDLKNILNRGIENLSLGSSLKFEKDENTNFMHPGKSSTIFIDKTELGIIGELHPDYLDKLEIDKKVYLVDISIDVLNKLYNNSSYIFNSIPKFPSVRRDISLIVNKSVTSGEMISKINSVSNLVEDAWVFDLFEGDAMGKDKKSVGISILLRSDNKTLTDEDANNVQNLAINELNKSLGAELRSI